ncbi:MAG: hypothetical protein GY866_24105, partial [Proteobacteria bacterium]|nr:hypothetical protein [Pseudomonadota bacterium]
MSERTKEDIFNEVHNIDGSALVPRRQGTKALKPFIPAKKLSGVQQKASETVTTVDERVIKWQDVINQWRVTILQNETIINFVCLFAGIGYCYAINECTGQFEFPAIVYWLFGSLILTCCLLLISAGSMPLSVLVKFAVSGSVGHIGMMYLIALDGHYFQILAVAMCRYPATFEDLYKLAVGAGLGYLFAKYEETKELRKTEEA